MNTNRRIRFPAVVAMLALAAGLLVASTGKAIDTNTYTGDINGNWSVDANWSQGHKPLGAEVVRFTNNVSFTNTVDENFTVDRVLFDSGNSAAIKISSSGGSTLTLNGMSRVSNRSAYDQFNVPIVLASDATFIGSSSGGGYVLNSIISGAFKLTVTNPSSQFQLFAANTFSGGLDIFSGYVRFNNGCLGAGPVTMGSGNGSGGAVLFYNTAAAYSLTTNTVTVAAGTGERTLYTQASGASTLPLTFVLNTNLTFSLTAGAKCTLSGAISGSGGIVKNDSISTTGILAGACTYLGATLVSKGTLILNGTMSNVNFAIGHTNIVSLVNGSGTNWFRDGNLIDVNTNGTLDATLLKFDLTRLTTNVAVLVDYSHSGTFTGPTPLQDMFTPASLRSFTVTDTASQVVATRKPSGTVFFVH